MPQFTLIAGIMPLFAYAYFAVPEGTPFRWKKITSYIKDHLAKIQSYGELTKITVSVSVDLETSLWQYN